VRVLWFGTYSLGGGYPRNSVLIEALRSRGVEVVECHAPLFKDAHDKVAAARGGSLKLVMRMSRAWMRLARRYRTAGPRDAVVVGYTGHFDLYWARFLGCLRRRPLILDAFLSPWDTVVRDRGIMPARSWRARLLFRIERRALRMADHVLTDTAAHADYMAETFGVSREKFTPIPVGSLVRNRVAAPVPVPVSVSAGKSSPRASLQVFFCGSFVPLQGVPIILDAAALCPEIEFRIVGDGPGAERILEELAHCEMPNVDVDRRFISREELIEELALADVVLGVFGASEKTGRVVPCKVYDALAAGRCVVTGDGEAPRQLLENGEEVLLVRRNDPVALAAALRKLAGNPLLRERLAAAGRAAYEARFDRDAIGRALAGVLEGVAGA